MGDKRTAPSIFRMKTEKRRIVCLTAYDSTSATLAQAAEPDLILVGDSVGNTLMGYATTIPVDMIDMVRHTKMVAPVVKNALLVSDLPFGSYQASPHNAVDNAVQLLKAGAEAVKLEGPYFEAIELMVRAGIPVMGHVGLTPQSVHAFGGMKSQGKRDPDRVLDMAKGLSDAGAFAIVLESIPSTLAQSITEATACPTIGIGAGPHCDGEIQVFHDVVGLTPVRYRHAGRYCEGADLFQKALETYVREAREGVFPGPEQTI